VYSISDSTKDTQPREHETDRKANGGLDQVGNEGNADCGVHVRLQIDRHSRDGIQVQKKFSSSLSPRRSNPLLNLTE